MMPNQSPVGVLCHGLPKYVTKPPIEAVVFAWGVNEDGQLGLDDKQNVATPKVVEAFLGMRLAGRSFYRTPIVTGSRNTLAIDVDGQVWSWGWNDRATLGLGHQMPVSKPQRLAALAGVHVIQVAVNGWHCLALSEQGQVFAWGGNEYFQCGVDREKRDIVLPTPCLPGLKVRQVACGGMHSLALTEEGTVWTWGEPWGDFSLNVERQPRPVPGAVNMASIAAGAFHNMALSYEGQVFTWGTNDYGQLGNGHTTYDTQPTPVLDMEGVLVSDIAAGGWHSLAITIHGEVYAWGRGEYGRLGIGDPTGSSKLRPYKVRALEGHRIVQVAAGGTHTMAVSIEGRMWSWGRSSFGRLGLGNGIGKEDIYSPIEVTLPGGPGRWHVCALACGGRHSICLALPLHDRLVGGSSVASESEMISEEVDGVSEASLFCRDVVLGGGEASNGAHAASGPVNTYSFHNGSGGFNTSAFNTSAPGNQSTFAGAGDNASIAAASLVARMGSAASASTATTGGRSSAAQILVLSGPSGEGDVGLPPLELPMPPDSATDGAASTPAMVLPPGMGSSSGAARALSGQDTPPSTAGSPSKPLPPATPAPAAPAAAPVSTAPATDTTPAEKRLPVMPPPSEAGGSGSGMAAAAAAALAAPPSGQLVVSPDTTPLHMNPLTVPALPVGGSLLRVTSASAPVTPIASGPAHDLDALPSIELQVGLKPTHDQRLSVDVSGPAHSASSNLGVVTALSSVGSGTTPDGTALAASSTLYTMPPTINTTISGGWSQGLAQGGSSSPRPRSAGSRGSSRRQQSGNISSPTRAGGVGAGRTFAAAVSPTHKDVLVHQMSGGFGRENSVGVASDGQDKEWAVVEEEEEAAVAPGAAALAVWPGKGTDMHKLVDMTLESEDVGEQRKAAAKARRRAARNEHLHTRNHSFDSSQAIASGSYQPPHPMLEGDSSSPTDREEEPGDDEDDHALSAHSGVSRVSYHAMHPDGLDVRTVPRPVSPSHAYLGRNLGFVPPGSPVGAAQLQASLMSPVRLSGSPHEQVVVDVAARLAAAVVGSPRNSNFIPPMTFNEILAMPRSISPLPVASSLSNPPPTPTSRTASAASAPSATAAAANTSSNSWRSSSGTVPIAAGGLQHVHSGGSGGAVDIPPPAERGRSMPTIAKSPRAGARRRAGGNSGGGLAVGSGVAFADSGSQSGTPAAGISPQGSLPHPSSLGGGTDEDEIHDALMASLSRPMAV